MKKLFTSKWLYLSIFFLIFLFAQIGFSYIFGYYKFGDDIVYLNDYANYNSILNWTINYCATWSSRVLIEFVSIIFCLLPEICFQIVNSLVFVLAIYSISKLFTKDTFINVIFVGLCMCLFPIIIFFNIGWIVTSIAYLFPLSFGLYGCFLIKDIIENKEIKPFKYVIYLLSLLFASSHELMCLILLCVFIIVSIYLYIINKKIDKKMIIAAVLIGINLIYILSSVGNEARTLQEINDYYPEFINFSIFDKLLLGIITTVKSLINTPLDNAINSNSAFGISTNGLFGIIIKTYSYCSKWLLTSSILMFIIVLINTLKNKRSIINYLSIALFLIEMILYFTVDISFIKNNMVFDNITLNKSISIILLLIIIIINFVISLRLIIKNNKDYLLSLLILAAGFTSRIVIGLSPTCFASSDRTCTYLFASLIIICSILFDKLLLISKNESK